MNKIVISFASKIIDSSSEVEYSIFSENDHPIFESERCTIGELQASLANKGLEGGQRVFVIAPGEDIILTQVAMPSKQKKHIQKALPFLIEDTLASDIDDVFFALGKADGSHLPVAIVDSEVLAQWIDTFRQNDLYLEAVYPDFSLLSGNDDEKEGLENVFCFDDSSISLIQENGRGYRFDKSLLPIYLKSLALGHEDKESSGDEALDSDGAEADEAEETTEGSNSRDGKVNIRAIILSPDGSTDSVAEREFLTEALEKVKIEEGIGFNVEIETVTKSYFQYLSEILVGLPRNSQKINLLQAQFKAKRKASKFKLDVNWKPVTALAAVFLIIYTVFISFETKKLVDASFDLNLATKDLYKEIFPKARGKDFVDMKGKVSDKLSDGGGEASGNLFGKSIFLLSQALNDINQSQAGALEPQQIDFEQENQEVKLDVIVGSFELLDAFKEKALEKGFEVDISSANSEGDSVKARMKLRLLN